MTFTRQKTVLGENSIPGTRPAGKLWIALRSVVYATLFLTLWPWVALLCRALDKYFPFRIPGGFATPGKTLVLAGAALDLATVFFFIFEGLGTPALFDPPKRFVPHGPYRFARNPMYFGYLAVLLGLGFYLQSVSMVLFVGIAFALIHTFVILAEEPGLRKRFGQEYEDYCRAVPRWI